MSETLELDEATHHTGPATVEHSGHDPAYSMLGERLSTEASAYLERSDNNEVVQAMTERIGQLAELDTSRIDQSTEHHANYQTTEGESAPYDRSKLVEGLISGIARRAGAASVEASRDTGGEHVTADRLWEAVLDSQLRDIEIAGTNDDQEKVGGLLLEHMAALELAHTESDYDRSEGRRKSSERAKLSMLRIAQMGLSGQVITVARQAHGLVVATPEDPLDRYDVAPRKDGKKVTTIHQLQSVAHAFEESLPAVEVGLGTRISLNPSDQTTEKFEVTADVIDGFDTLDSVIAAATRSNKAGNNAEDLQLVKTLNQRALRSMVEVTGDHDDQTRQVVQALEVLLEISPELATSTEYEADFAFIRQNRQVGSNYRQNSQSTYRLDSEIVLLVAAGKLELAKRMITANPAELRDPDYPETRGVLGLAIRSHLSGQFSETDQQSILSQLESMQAEKAEVLQAQLSETLVSLSLSEYRQSELSRAVLDAPDPESALYGLQTIQKAAGEEINPDELDRVMGILIEPTGSSNLTVLDEMSMHADILAPVLFSEDFRKLDEQYFGSRARLVILRNPERADQILRLYSHPNLQKYFGEAGDQFIPKAVEDSALAEKTLAVLDQAGSVLSLISDTGITRESSSVLMQSLLTAEDLTGRVQELEEALTETRLLELIGREGPAYTFQSTIINLVTNAENSQRAAQQACELLLTNDPLWLRCYKISQIGVGNIEEVGYQTGLVVKEVPLSLPVATLSQEQQLKVLQSEPPTLFAQLSIEQKRQVASLDTLSDQEVENLQEIEFSQMVPDYQRAILAHRLFETITLSRDPMERQAASGRNQAEASSGQWINPGDLVHATNSSVGLRAILTSGALAGETLGFKGRADSYPFNLDTVVVSPDVISQPNHSAQLGALKNQSFGQIALVFGRDSEALHAGEEFQGGMNDDHRLLLGGLPSTEISAVLLRGEVSQETITAVKRVVVESGIYIPVVSPAGELLLTSEEFTELQTDENIQAVQPSIVDGSFERPNSQGGSNEGAEFIVPRGADRDPEHWYVKFGDDNPDRLWTEILADRFYAKVTPEVVPETIPVIVEGRLARASRMMPIDDTKVTNEARNEAFVMDCLLGNWDAVYNDANILMSGGHGLRIDTGNSFDFRARGGKKPEGTFTEKVAELELGSDRENLGVGMRQMYPGLTDEQIERQVSAIKEKLTDEVIDQLIDDIRRTSADRTELKRIIKARRDYIFEYFAREAVAA